MTTIIFYYIILSEGGLNKMEKTLLDNICEIYERTLNNCIFYEQENKPIHLNNEIGVLRGIYYSSETIGIHFLREDEFRHFIKVQENFRKEERNGK